VQNIAKNFNRLGRAPQRRRRQTQTCHNANVTLYSSPKN